MLLTSVARTRTVCLGLVALASLWWCSAQEVRAQLPIHEVAQAGFDPQFGTVQQAPFLLSEFDPYATVTRAQFGEVSGVEVSPTGPGRTRGFYARLEFLLWWMDNMSIPPLVTSSPPGTPLTAGPGIIGEPGTRVLVGGDLNFSVVPGARFSLGHYFGPCRDTGIHFVFVGLSDKLTQSYRDPTITARPFFNVEPGLEGEDAELITHPDFAAIGGIRVRGDSDLYLADLLLSHRIAGDCCDWVDLLIGYRYGNLRERVLIEDSRLVTADNIPNLPQGTIFGEFDKFRTENTFNGPEFGFAWEGRSGCWTLQLLSKLAIGNTRSTVRISGQTTSTLPGETPVVTPQGLLALNSNIGSYKRNDFTVIPELGLTLGYRFRNRLHLTTGYSLVYWSQTARPGDQIDRNVNLSEIRTGTLTGIPAPQFRFVREDYWAQGLNFGAGLTF